MMELLLADASPGGRLLAGGVGGLLVLASGAMLISEFRFRCRGHAVPAKVLRYRTFLDSDGDTMHAAIFQFELGGAWFEVEDSFAFGRPAFPTGATVTLVPPRGASRSGPAPPRLALGPRHRASDHGALDGRLRIPDGALTRKQSPLLLVGVAT